MPLTSTRRKHHPNQRSALPRPCYIRRLPSCRPPLDSPPARHDLQPRDNATARKSGSHLRENRANPTCAQPNEQTHNFRNIVRAAGLCETMAEA